MKKFKTQLMLGHTLEFSNDADLIHVWYSRSTNSFCIQLNAVVIDSLRTFKIFEMKLQNLLKKKEIELVANSMCDFCGVIKKAINSNYCNVCKHEAVF